MTPEIQLLTQAITPIHAPQQEINWKRLLKAIRSVISKPLNWETERILLEIMRFDGRINLTSDSSVPHSLSPEDMLKSLAAQALGRWTGLTHIYELQRLEVTTASPVLASILGGVIRKAQTSKLSESDSEPIEEVESGTQTNIEYWTDVWEAGPLSNTRKSGGTVTIILFFNNGLPFIPDHQSRRDLSPPIGTQWGNYGRVWA